MGHESSILRAAEVTPWPADARDAMAAALLTEAAGAGGAR